MLESNSSKFWDWTIKTGTKNRKYHFPHKKGFSFQEHTLCSGPAKSNTWYSFSVLAYIRLFLVDAQAADLDLWISWSSSPAGHKKTLGLACPVFMPSAEITEDTGKDLLSCEMLTFLLNCIIEDEQLCTRSFPTLLQSHKGPQHV